MTKLAHDSVHPAQDNVQYVLYVDACKLGYGAALHLVRDKNTREWKRKEELPVCFVSRKLKNNERNYWLTELEAGGLVWALEKLAHIIEGQPLTIYTDHSALTWLFNATNIKTKSNQRLTLWALSLQKWKSHARIIHRPGRSHCNADVLSRFPVASSFPENLREDTALKIPGHTAVVNATMSSSKETINSVQIGMDSKLQNAIAEAYPTDKHFKTIWSCIQKSNGPQYHNFTLRSGLLWLSLKGSERLAVPDAVHQQFFHAAHDQTGHLGFFPSLTKDSTTTISLDCQFGSVDISQLARLAASLRTAGTAKMCCIPSTRKRNVSIPLQWTLSQDYPPIQMCSMPY